VARPTVATVAGPSPAPRVLEVTEHASTVQGGLSMFNVRSSSSVLIAASCVLHTVAQQWPGGPIWTDPEPVTFPRNPRWSSLPA